MCQRLALASKIGRATGHRHESRHNSPVLPDYARVALLSARLSSPGCVTMTRSSHIDWLSSLNSMWLLTLRRHSLGQKLAECLFGTSQPPYRHVEQHILAHRRGGAAVVRQGLRCIEQFVCASCAWVWLHRRLTPKQWKVRRRGMPSLRG